MMAPCLSATSGLPFAVLAVNVFAVAAWYLSLPPSSASFGFDDFVKVKGKHVSNKPSVKPTPETGFERFLRAPPDTAPSGVERPSVNAFTSFLKVVSPSVPRAAAVAASPVHPLAGSCSCPARFPFTSFRRRCRRGSRRVVWHGIWLLP